MDGRLQGTEMMNERTSEGTNFVNLFSGFFTTLSMVTKLFASECDSAFIGLVCQCGAAFVVTGNQPTPPLLWPSRTTPHFSSSGKILYETRLTQAIGEVLVGRVTYMTHNWYVYLFCLFIDFRSSV